MEIFMAYALVEKVNEKALHALLFLKCFQLDNNQCVKGHILMRPVLISIIIREHVSIMKRSTLPSPISLPLGM